MASLQRLRLNKDEEESDARGDLSSAIVTSAAMEQSEAAEGSVDPKAAPRVSDTRQKLQAAGENYSKNNVYLGATISMLLDILIVVQVETLIVILCKA